MRLRTFEQDLAREYALRRIDALALASSRAHDQDSREHVRDHMRGAKTCRNCRSVIWVRWNRCSVCGELAGRASRPSL